MAADNAKRTKVINVVEPYQHLNDELLIAPRKGELEFDDVTSDKASYGSVQFWDARYAHEHEPFEWYYGYSYFRETILEYCDKYEKVLLAGCGSSNMIGDMADDGYTKLIANDFSRVVLKQLEYRYADYPQISYFHGTMTDTDIPRESIRAVIDKALFDSMLCTQTGPVNIAQYVNEVERILDDDGVFIIISHGNPETRLIYLEQYDIDEPYFTPWVVEVQALMKPREHDLEEFDPNDPNSMYFVYICRKTRELVVKKKLKEKRMNKKQAKAALPQATRKRAPNLKPT